MRMHIIQVRNNNNSNKGITSFTTACGIGQSRHVQSIFTGVFVYINGIINVKRKKHKK